MDVTIATALITGSAALLGATVGGLTSYFTTARQHRRQVKQEREDTRRDREHSAAKECEALCLQMAADMEKVRHPAHAKHDDAEDQREERVDAAHRKLGAVSLYLPVELRERVESIGDIVHDADDLGYGSLMGGPCHYHQPYTICWHARREIRGVVAAFLKDEPLPDPRPTIVEYRAALNDLHREREEYYRNYDDSPQEQAYRQDREDFYKRHPELRRDAKNDE